MKLEDIPLGLIIGGSIGLYLVYLGINDKPIPLWFLILLMVLTIFLWWFFIFVSKSEKKKEKE